MSTSLQNHISVVPKFVIRRFKTPESKASQEIVNCYNAALREVEKKPGGTLYTAQGLCHGVDVRQDAADLEKNLGILESKASKIVAKIHDAVAQPKNISLSRSEVGNLEKYLFIISFRVHALSLSAFAQDHAECDAIRTKLEKHWNAKGFSAAGLWLYMLQYYLTTPHEEILEEYHQIADEHGQLSPSQLNELLSSFDNPVRFEVVEYGALWASYTMSIWEAADGEEFILGQNAFGLCEGMLLDHRPVHRIFIVSPRIALVLRAIGAIPQESAPANVVQDDSSRLLDVPFPRIEVEYAGFKDAAEGDREAGDVKMRHYLKSPVAKNDHLKFTKVKLSRDQTREVNFTVFRNVKSDGSLVFHSEPYILKLANACSISADSKNALSRDLTSGLERILVYSVTPRSETTERRDEPENSRPTNSKPQQASTSFDAQLVNIVGDIMMDNTTAYRSYYDALYTISRLCDRPELGSNPIVEESCRIGDELARRFLTLLKPPPPGFQPNPQARMVQSMTPLDSAKFLGLIVALLDRIGLPSRPRETYTSEVEKLKGLIQDVAAMKFVENVARVRHDSLLAMVGMLMPGLKLLE